MVKPYKNWDYIGPNLGLRLGDLFKLQKKGPRKPGLRFFGLAQSGCHGRC